MFSPRDWRLRLILAAAGAAFVAFAAVSVLGMGGSSARAPKRAAAPAPTTTPIGPVADYQELSPHVASKLGILTIQGSGKNPPQPPGLEYPPFSPSRFNGPVAQYRAYADAQLKLMSEPLDRLQAALTANDRDAAENAWKDAYARYLHLGAVYLEGRISDLNDAIDGSPGGLPGGTSNPHFSGLHRIEFGLWTGAQPSSLLPYVQGLRSDVARMRTVLPKVSMTPLDYSTRAHEILEDAARDLLSGTAVPWSHAGVLGTAAGVAATREVLGTLKPLINPTTADADLDILTAELDSLAAAHGGTYPSNTQLTQAQSERLNAALGQALEGLAQVPGSLETAPTPTIPTIPRSAVVIDPS